MSIKNIKIITLSLFIGLIFAGGITLAAAIWQGTGWIQNGAVIDAQKMRDDFDYLYALHDVNNVACSENITGTVRYNNASFEYCNGTQWVAVNASGGGISFGEWENKSIDTVYQAMTDGIVVAYMIPHTSGPARSLAGYTDSNSSPTTIVARTVQYWGGYAGTISFPVKQGDYWKVTVANKGNTSVEVRFMPMQ